LRRLINGLAAAAKESRLSPDSFVVGSIKADEAHLLFNALVAAGFLTPIGLVTDNQASYPELSKLFPVTEAEFVSQDITMDESRQAFNQLATHSPPYIILKNAGDIQGTLSSDFTAETSLSFLFDVDPLQSVKEAEVRNVLLQVKRNIEEVQAILVSSGL
jgi:hypothetical protein